MKTRKYWSKEEFIDFKKSYEIDGMSPSELCIKFNRDIVSINNKIARAGLHHTPEQIFRIKSNRASGQKNPMYGKESWKKGLTKENSEKVKLIGIKLSKKRKQMFKDGLLPDVSGENNPMYGKPSWNLGLTKETDKRVETISFKMKQISKERWNNYTEKEKDEKRKHCALIGANCKKRKTSIEIIIENFLKEINVAYISGYYKDNWVFDFYLPDKNLVIECQGDYWHSNPLKYNETNINNIQKRNIDRDDRKQKFLQNNKIDYIFLWEYDIKRNFDHVKNEILKRVNI